MQRGGTDTERILIFTIQVITHEWAEHRACLLAWHPVAMCLTTFIPCMLQVRSICIAQSQLITLTGGFNILLVWGRIWGSPHKLGLLPSSTYHEREHPAAQRHGGALPPPPLSLPPISFSLSLFLSSLCLSVSLTPFFLPSPLAQSLSLHTPDIN